MADDDATAKAKAAKDLIKEAIREMKAEDEEKTRTNPPAKKSTSIVDFLFGG